MVLIFSLLIGWTNVALGQSSPTTAVSMNFEENFQQGVKLYQNKDFKAAHSNFEEALKQQPHNISVLTNLGLVTFDMGKKGLALGYLRRALELEPDFRPAEQAYDYVWSQLEVKELPHRIETYETFRQYFLKEVSLSSYLLLGGLCFLISGWLLIRYFGVRKKAMQQELPLPPVPGVGFTVGFFFIALFILSLFKLYDLSIQRGTIILEKVSMHTAPSESEASLFELTQGLEVVARKTEGDWVQVTYPGGPTGWIKKSELMMTTLGSF